MNEQKEFDPYAKSIPENLKPSGFLSDINSKPIVPGFLIQAKEYLKQHPEAIREVAGEEISKLEAYLDTLPLGIGAIGKAKLNEYLDVSGTQSNSNQNAQDDAGTQNSGIQVQTDEHISSETWAEILEFMADLDSQGFTPGRIAEDVEHDYGLHFHPLKVRKLLDEYYRKVDIGHEIIEVESKDIETDDRTRQATMALISKLKAENMKYRNIEIRAQREREIQVAVDHAVKKHTPQPQINSNIQQTGLIRRFLRWLV